MKTISLAGNPNSGKTTVFNKLTGSSQRVGNWPGVTIDRKEGRIKGLDSATLVDLPGIYSLSPYSPEEVVSRDYLLKERPDVILNVVDGSNLERNLYLTVQLMEVGIPVVIALNMMDIARAKGFEIDSDALGNALGCKVIEATAAKGEGMEEIKKAISEVSSSDLPKNVTFGKDVEDVLEIITSKLKPTVPRDIRRWAAVKVFEKDASASDYISEDVSAEIEAIEQAHDDISEAIIIDQRYNAICDIVSRVLVMPSSGRKKTLSDKVDDIVTGRILGFPIFFGIMALVYTIAMLEGSPGWYATDWLNTYIGDEFIPMVADWLAEIGVEGMLFGLIVDGILSGVGAVLGFLPQMLVMFLLLVLLEEVGYMSRVAFVMDRIFRKFGLSGKSFIPLLVGTGCGVPGVMASRTIENERDRRITAMTTTFMPCAAKLPIVALIAGAIFNGNPLVALGCYFGGILAVLISGVILKKFKRFAGEPTPFIMELPPYHAPSVVSVGLATLQRGWGFVKKAFTIVLLATVLIWFLSSYTWTFQEAEIIDDSILASIGNAICGIFAPLGFGNWELSVATITGLMAKEDLVGTLGTIAGIEIEEAEGDLWLWLATIVTPIGAVGLLAFNMLCAPCFAAIGAMHRELGGWKATAFAVGYQCVFAYVCSLILVQFGGLLFGYDVNIGYMVMAIVAAVVLAYFIIAKDPIGNIKALAGKEA
ncbi:MAG: ferrous iron transport protein B [Thermoplasmata archaeon]|nr:ferrous iron transport protein B [Thermoplasmata archaeon]